MSKTLELSTQVQKAIAKLNALIKEKSKTAFDEDALHLNLIKEMLKEQDLQAHDQNPRK